MTVTPAILFVCLGNICRSPLAEAAFRSACKEAGLAACADSAGLGHWHVGNPPDARAQDIASKMGCEIGNQRARQVCPEDFSDFTHILAMDEDNLRTLRRLQPAGTSAQVSLLLDHVTGREGQEVADPYYGGREGFAVTWTDVTAGAKGLVRTLMSER